MHNEEVHQEAQIDEGKLTKAKAIKQLKNQEKLLKNIQDQEIMRMSPEPTPTGQEKEIEYRKPMVGFRYSRRKIKQNTPLR
jgi:23S rRNA maturation-related 3'-5' exoribonuclease YhaM